MMLWLTCLFLLFCFNPLRPQHYHTTTVVCLGFGRSSWPIDRQKKVLHFFCCVLRCMIDSTFWVMVKRGGKATSMESLSALLYSVPWLSRRHRLLVDWCHRFVLFPCSFVRTEQWVKSATHFFCLLLLLQSTFLCGMLPFWVMVLVYRFDDLRRKINWISFIASLFIDSHSCVCVS